MNLTFPPPYITIEYYYNTFKYNDFQALFWDNVRAVQNQWYGVTVNHIECHPLFLKDILKALEPAVPSDKEHVTLFGIPVKTQTIMQRYQITVYFKVPDENKDQS